MVYILHLSRELKFICMRSTCVLEKRRGLELRVSLFLVGHAGFRATS